MLPKQDVVVQKSSATTFFWPPGLLDKTRFDQEWVRFCQIGGTVCWMKQKDQVRTEATSHKFGCECGVEIRVARDGLSKASKQFHCWMLSDWSS